MRKFIVLFLVSIIVSKASHSQSAIIRGNISDTVDKKLLENGSVLLMRKADSIMISFTRTDKNGNFQFKNLHRGQFLIMVNYPEYADFIDDIEIKDSAAILDLPRIMMTLKSQLLKTVVVNGVSAIRLKGDTTEFKADSFKVQPNASVEDLLKKLPGIQVDKNGKITAEGETVQKVLVDGEEFFGDDPTLVTKNLRADMVDKVQVFDKKSD